MSGSIARIYDGMIEASARRYRREVHLPRILHLFPHELKRRDRVGRLRILGKIRLAARAERRRGLLDHWSYAQNRHLALLGAFRAECRAFKDRTLLAAILEESDEN